jgi:hypothetical protein
MSNNRIKVSSRTAEGRKDLHLYTDFIIGLQKDGKREVTLIFLQHPTLDVVEVHETVDEVIKLIHGDHTVDV